MLFYEIKVYRLGQRGITIRSYCLQFNSLIEADLFAASMIKDGEGYEISLAM